MLGRAWTVCRKLCCRLRKYVAAAWHGHCTGMYCTHCNIENMADASTYVLGDASACMQHARDRQLAIWNPDHLH